MEKIYLESERLVLRFFVKADVDHLLDLDSDPEVMRYISDRKPSIREEAQAAIERILGYYYRFENQMGIWLAFEKTTRSFAGWFLLRPDKKKLSDIRSLEVGYRLKRLFWNRGYATEVSRLLVEKAFRNLRADSVFATAMAANLASISVMKKIGMEFHSNYLEEDFPGVDKNAVRYEISR